ncbi:MAG: DMT family protein [Bacteroidales bacterium]|nr:DMT family protein [Bacteroidales bacterium]
MSYFLPVFLLLLANIFMTLAWYGHLKLNQMGISTNWPMIATILFSWGIAFIEYCFQVPANKMGFIENGGAFSLLQLKVIQEALSILVFCVIANILFQGEKIAWNHLAAFGCLIMAVVFVFWKA